MIYDLNLTERREKFDNIVNDICEKINKEIYDSIYSELKFELHDLHKILDLDEIEYLSNSTLKRIVGYTDSNGWEFGGIKLKNKTIFEE